jgi:hypothetical protein
MSLNIIVEGRYGGGFVEGGAVLFASDEVASLGLEVAHPSQSDE